MYLVLKELTAMSDSVIIVISSLTKDMNSNIGVYKANSIRVLCNILTEVHTGMLVALWGGGR